MLYGGSNSAWGRHGQAIRRLHFVGAGFLLKSDAILQAMKSLFAFVGIIVLATIIGVYFIGIKNPSSPIGGIFMPSFSITSPVFENGASIPSYFTCDGANLSPRFLISGVPDSAKSLALIMDDPDVPRVLRPDGVFDHWILFNIPPKTAEIAEGTTVGTAGKNGAGSNRYTGPCPPPEYEPSEHRYFFRLYALDMELSLQEGAVKSDVLKAMEGHVIGQAELIGKYKKAAQ